MIYKPAFPVTGARRDILGATTPVAIAGEEHNVVDGYIKLREVPQSISGTQNVLITGYTEVFAAPGVGQFRVNYATGRVFFHTSQEGALVRATYKGLGSLTAVDEINWLWEELTVRRTFADMLDGPGEYDGHAYSFLQVNKTETALEFVAPAIGRSTCKYLVYELAAGETVTAEATRYDVVTAYEITLREEAGTVAAGEWVMDPEDSIILVDSSDESSMWMLADPATMPNGMMRADNMVMLDDWNNISDVTFNHTVPANTTIKIMFTINGMPHIYRSGGFTPFAVNSPVDVLLGGMSPEDLAFMTQSTLSGLIGKSIGLIVAMSSTDGVATPSFDGVLMLHGERGGGYSLATFVDINISTEAMLWSFKNTSAESKRVLVVLGSGRDEICCGSDELVFEDVPAGGSFVISAPKQTTLQAYEKNVTTTAAALAVTTAAQWVSVDGVLNAGVGSSTRMQMSDTAKRLDNAYGSLYSLMTLDNGTIYDKFGHYGFGNNGAKTILPGFVGPAVYMANTSHIVVSDSWLFESSAGGTQSGTRYPNRSIGGLFKWVSGYPAIITPNCGQEYASYRGGWYQNCAAYLASNYVGINCGRTWKYMYYPAGSWVFVSLTNMWGRWIGGAYDDKQISGTCNGQIVNAYHKESEQVSGLDRLLAVPNCIGNGASQIPSTGAFMVDTAFVARVGPMDLGPMNNMQNLMSSYRASMVATRNIFAYKLATSFSGSAWPDIKNMVVAQKNSLSGATVRFLFESDGVLYAYNFTDGTYHPTNMTQPLASLWDVATPENQIASIPNWKMEQISGAVMNVWMLSKSGAVSGLAPTDSFMGEVAHLYAGLTIYTGDQMQSWKMLNPQTDYTLSWNDDTRSWKFTNLKSAPATIRIIVSGQAAPQVLGAASLFTDLADTPNSIGWEGKRILVAGDGVVTTLPYINALMMGMP